VREDEALPWWWLFEVEEFFEYLTLLAVVDEAPVAVPLVVP